jgi:hypothetical protein
VTVFDVDVVWDIVEDNLKVDDPVVDRDMPLILITLIRRLLLSACEERRGTGRTGHERGGDKKWRKNSYSIS